MPRYQGCVEIHVSGAYRPFRPYAVSRKYEFEMPGEPDEQLAGAEVMDMWRAEGSRTMGGPCKAGIEYEAYPKVEVIED